tara:strand:+ start:162 stop:350 length:189 start_codon:yes stop_codon:yes gene_type:complete
MDIEARIEELTQQQQALLQRHQEDAMNIQRLAGAIAFAREQLAEEQKSPNGTVADEAELATP